MPSKALTNIISVNILGVTSWRRTESYRSYGCFNFLNIYTTTRCKWDFMLDASAIQLVQLQNANYIVCWMLQLTQHIQVQNTNEDFKETTNNYKKECKYKKVGPTPLFCTKRPLAGNLYCSRSPPLYVAVIWSRIQKKQRIWVWKISMMFHLAIVLFNWHGSRLYTVMQLRAVQAAKSSRDQTSQWLGTSPLPSGSHSWDW